MIKILYRYIIGNYFKIFLVSTSAFSVIVIVSQLLGNQMKEYIEKKPPFSVTILHVLVSTPEWLIQALPIATLLALLFSLGNLSKRSEVTALKAAGINMWRIICIFLVVGFIIGVTDFACREFVVTKTVIYSKKIKTEKIKKEEENVQTDFYNQIIALKNNIRVTVGHLDTKTNTMKNIVVEVYNEDFELQKLVLAEEADWENGAWILKNGVSRGTESDFMDEIYFKTYDSNIYITPEDIAFKDPPYNSMTTSDFKKYINRLGIFGKSSIKAKIELNTRYAAVFSHIIVIMIGVPFAVGFGRKTNMIFSFLSALSVTFMYWATQAVTASLGKNLAVSPFMAAWLPNFIFLGIGIYLLIKVRK